MHARKSMQAYSSIPPTTWDMEYRPLGRTGLEVSVIGVGVEHLKNQPEESIADVVGAAVSRDVNYFDLVWSLPNVIRGVAKGIGEAREEVHLAVHLGSCYRDGGYLRSRTPSRCEEVFHETLGRLGTSYADVINIHYVGDFKQWEIVSEPGGVLDLAVRLRDEGAGRVVAISTHDIRVVKRAAEHPEIGSVMYQVNMANPALPGRDEALRRCAETGTGVVAMKPYAAGKLLLANRTVSFSKYQTGGLTLKKKLPVSMTPVRCLSYTLSQPGVSCAVTGVKNVDELHGGLEYLRASDPERDYERELGEILS